MNCAVCGSPLAFDRVVFRCSCGVFIHSYCWDNHILEAHKPIFEMGTINLNDEFKPIKNEVSDEIEDEQVAVLVDEETQEV